MRKQTSKLEWHFSESDAEWEQQQALRPLEITPALRRRLQVYRYLWHVAPILLLLVGAGEWWRRASQATRQAAAGEVRPPVEQKSLAVVTSDGDALVTMIRHEQRNADWWRQHAWEYNAWRAPTQTDEPTGDEAVALHRFAFQGDQAMVSNIMTNPNGETMYR